MYELGPGAAASSGARRGRGRARLGGVRGARAAGPRGACERRGGRRLAAYERSGPLVAPDGPDGPDGEGAVAEGRVPVARQRAREPVRDGGGVVPEESGVSN
jgi:hypothetical protein